MVELSVVVPFFNVRQYAPDTLRSLHANSAPEVEFLLVDDASTDGTAEFLERAAAGLPGARVLRHEVNGGLATARNTGIEAARGRHLTFLDGDDWYAPGYLPQLLCAAEELATDFVRVDHVQCTGRARSVIRLPYGRRGQAVHPRDAILPADRSTSVDYAFAWAGIYHRRLVDAGLVHFVDGLRTAEDRPWIWRLHREAASFAVVGLTGVHYRRGVATSLTQIGDVRQLDFIRAMDRVIADTSADRDAGVLLPKAVRTYCAIMAHHLGSTERFEPAVAKQLRTMCAAAMSRLPQRELDRALDALDVRRAVRLRRLRRRSGDAGRTEAA